jgi:hypothetical protein
MSVKETSIVLVMFVAAIAAIAFASAEQSRPQPPAPPAVHQSAGHVVIHDSAALHRFEQPAAKPFISAPAFARAGHVWRWHPHFHRWILLPVAVAGPVEVLASTFALPAGEVVSYAQSCQCTCPHCGAQISISVQ